MKTGRVEAWMETRRREPSGWRIYFARTLCRAKFSGMGLKKSQNSSADGEFEDFDRDTSTSTFDVILSPISSTYMEGKCRAGEGNPPVDYVDTPLFGKKGGSGCAAGEQGRRRSRRLADARHTLAAGRAAPSRLWRSLAPAPRPGVAASRTVRGCQAPPGGGPPCAFGADDVCAGLHILPKPPLA